MISGARDDRDLRRADWVSRTKVRTMKLLLVVVIGKYGLIYELNILKACGLISAKEEMNHSISNYFCRKVTVNDVR